MPKQYIIEQANDILFWSSFYRKLIKFLLFLCLVMVFIVASMFAYNIYLKENSFFVITTFGQVIEISPIK